MNEQAIHYLPGEPPWQNHIYQYEVTDSTNTRAKELALEGAPHGTVVIADCQTGGRGRLGRSFHSPGGNGVYMSMIFRYPCAPEQLLHLTCAAAVAACDAVEAAVGFRPGIKWTNDLVSGSRKLAGILTELICLPGEVAAVIGIGINCTQTEADFPPEIRSFAGSLSMVCGKPTDRKQVASALIGALLKMDLNRRAEAMADYHRDCVTLGKDISLVRGNEIRHGHALDIDECGALIVRFPDGHTETVNSGEVSIRGMYGYI